MPLSKANKREYQRRLYKEKLGIRKANVLPNQCSLEHCVICNPDKEDLGIRKPNDKPNWPWYAGAGDHFGEIKSKYYAKQFFDNLFET